MRIHKLIKTFSIFLNNDITFFDRKSIEKIQKVKIQKLQGQKTQRIIILSKCEMYPTKKTIFIKVQEARGLLSTLRTKKPLTKIPLVAPIWF